MAPVTPACETDPDMNDTRQIATMPAKSASSSLSVHDVAKALGVSTATVSRAFTPGASISEKTRQRVLEKANELGYQPNIIAKMLNTRKSHLVGLVTGPLNINPYYADFMTALTQALQARGYQLMLFTARNDEDISDSVLQAMQYQAEAIVIANAVLSQKTALSLSKNKRPIIAIAPPYTDLDDTSPIHFVSADNTDMGRQAADILLSHGYRTLQILSGPMTNPINRQRATQCLHSLEQQGVATTHIIADEDSYNAGFDTAEQIIGQPVLADAVLCTSDILAMGFLDRIKQQTTLSVPEDIGLLAIDGTSTARFHAYDLSTIAVPFSQEIQRIIEIISGKHNQSERTHLFPGFYIPGSTLPAN